MVVNISCLMAYQMFLYQTLLCTQVPQHPFAASGSLPHSLPSFIFDVKDTNMQRRKRYSFTCCLPESHEWLAA